MPEAQSGLTRTAAQLHSAMKAAADEVGILLVDGFHYLAFRDRRDNRLVSACCVLRNVCQGTG